MKKLVIVLSAITLMFSACVKQDSKKQVANSDEKSNTISSTFTEIRNSVIYNNKDIKVDIVYSTIDDSVNGKKMNDIIEKTIAQKLLVIGDSVNIEASDIKSAIKNIVHYKQTEDAYLPKPYEIKITNDISLYDNEVAVEYNPDLKPLNIVSVKFDAYIYLGGANGTNIRMYLNFDLNTGELLDLKKEFNLGNKQLTELKAEFCKKYNIDINSSANEAGLFIAPDSLSFPNSEFIGLEHNKLQFVYKQYEIAPRSFGIVQIGLSVD